MSKKTILFLIPTLGHGGAEKVLVNLVNNMDLQRFDVVVQTLFDEGVNKQYLSPQIKYKSFLKHQFRGNSHIIKLLPAKLLYRLIVKDRYDIVVSYLEGPTSRIISGCPYPDSKKVAWIHVELNDAKKYMVGFPSHTQATTAYLQYDQIICVSKTVRDIFEASAGIHFPRIQVLYNTNETKQIRDKSTESLEDFHLDKGIINICSVGRLTYAKGFDRLVKVSKRLKDEGIHHRIYILGVGEQKAELEKYIAANDLSDTVILLGFQQNPYKYMAACDFYICSSRREGFSTAVTESLVVGTPVVSTSCSGAHELLGENNEFGIVTENSEDGIYAGMKIMLTDSSLREHYREMAKKRGYKFDTQSTVCAVEKMLVEL